MKKPKPFRRIWTMRDGTKIPVREMKDSHVKNARLMCLRGAAKAGRDSLSIIRCAFGEAFDAEHAGKALTDAVKSYAHFSGWIVRFERELKRRGVEFVKVPHPGPFPPRAIEASADPLFDGWGGEGRFK